MTGFTSELLQLPEKSILDLELESIYSLISMEEKKMDLAHHLDIKKAPKRSLDGVCNNLRSKESWKKIRKEMSLRSTPELFLIKAEGFWTESPLNTSNLKKLDLVFAFWSRFKITSSSSTLFREGNLLIKNTFFAHK